jgi:hypothetical protein
LNQRSSLNRSLVARVIDFLVGRCVDAKGKLGLRPMWKLPQIQAATIFSMIAIAISGASLIYSKRSYDLSAARDEREMMDKMPALDVQVRPDGATSAALTISIANRGDINLVPLDITAEHSFEAGELYISSAKQSADRLKTSFAP